MAGRSPARFLAPLVLVGFVIALFVVVTSSNTDTDPGGTGAPNQSSGTTPTASPAGTAEKPKGRRRYTVKAGDTPSSIAEKTGVPLEQILLLNPDLDPQTLSPGQRIQLRE
jgi:LysM repeat protein